MYIDNQYFSFVNHFTEDERKLVSAELSKYSKRYFSITEDIKLSIFLESAVITYNINNKDTTTSQIILRGKRELRDYFLKEKNARLAVKFAQKELEWVNKIEKDCKDAIINEDELSIYRNQLFELDPFSCKKMEEFYIEEKKLDKKTFDRMNYYRKKLNSLRDLETKNENKR